MNESVALYVIFVPRSPEGFSANGENNPTTEDADTTFSVINMGL